MPTVPSPSTCWTVVRAAIAGGESDRDAFARRYSPVVRAYLGARFRGSGLLAELDDAHQEIFVELFKPGGALERFEAGAGGGFRAFLFAVARNVALRIERGRAQGLARGAGENGDLDALARDETSLSRAFDRAWAQGLLEEAYRRLEEQAARDGETALRRVELLRLRFREDLPIQEIAVRWKMDAAALHREYARARREFLRALHGTVAFHHPEATAGEVEREAAHLLEVLQ